ncbi:MAG: HNH endonuclease [Paludibacteraceae bacterium]|nr:HNH endonuclease [Paludibacteraceae bacterium]
MKPTIIKLIPPELIGGKTYYADSDGNIRNAKGHIIKPRFGPAARNYKRGSCHPHVRIGGKECRIHILVCSTFWGMRKPGQHCHHLDGNKFNNRPTNLIFLDPDEHRRFDKAMRSGKIYVRSLVDPMVFEMSHHCEI